MGIFHYRKVKDKTHKTIKSTDINNAIALVSESLAGQVPSKYIFCDDRTPPSKYKEELIPFEIDSFLLNIKDKKVKKIFDFLYYEYELTISEISQFNFDKPEKYFLISGVIGRFYSKEDFKNYVLKHIGVRDGYPAEILIDVDRLERVGYKIVDLSIEIGECDD